MINRMRSKDGGLTHSDLLRFRSISREIFTTNPNGRSATIIVSSNDTRALLNQELIQLFAREHGMPVLRENRSSLILNEVETVRFYAEQGHHTTSYFVPGAPAYISENLNTKLGLSNGTKVEQHSLTIPFRSEDERIQLRQSIARASAGEVVFLSRPPSHVNVSVPHAQVDAWSVDRRFRDIQNEVVVPIPFQSKNDCVHFRPPLRSNIKGEIQIKRHAVKLGFAITYYKAQGKDLPYVLLDASLGQTPPIDFHHLYVGLTRVSNANNMRFISFANDSHVVELTHLLTFKPAKDLHRWLSGYDPHTHLWSRTRVLNSDADSNAIPGVAHSPLRPQSNFQTQPVQQPVQPPVQPPVQQPVQPTVQPPVQQRIQPRIQQPQSSISSSTELNARLPRSFVQVTLSRLFMPIIAAASGNLTLSRSQTAEFARMKAFVGEEWDALIAVYQHDFAVRGVEPFPGGRYQYLEAAVQEKLLLPISDGGESLISENSPQYLQLNIVAQRFRDAVNTI
jgi:hypothetical protein